MSREERLLQSEDIQGAPSEYWVLFPRADRGPYEWGQPGHMVGGELAQAQLADLTWQVTEVVPASAVKAHTALGLGPTVVNMVNMAFPKWTMSVATDERLGAAIRRNDVVMCSAVVAGPVEGHDILGAPSDRWSGFLRKVKFKRTSPPILRTIDVPVVRLHCPGFEGCEATYKSEVSTSKGRDLTVSVLGIGGGVGKRFKTAKKREFGARGRCMQLTRRARIEIVPGDTYVGDMLFSKGFRVNVVGIEHYPGDAPVPANEDLCNIPVRTLKKWERGGYPHVHPVRRGRAPPDSPLRKEAFEVLRSGTTRFGIDLKGDAVQMPFKVALEVVREVSEDIEVSYSLAPGATYYTYLPRDKSGEPSDEWCWTVKLPRRK